MKTWSLLLCMVALLLVQETEAQEYVLEKLNHEISSGQYHEIAPCISSDGKTMYFTRLGFPKFEKTLIEGGKNLNESLSPELYFRHLSSIYSLLGGKNITDPVRSAFNQDIWIAHSVDNEFDVLEHPNYPLNNALPNSVCALTPKDEPVIINQFAPDGGMKKGFSKVLKAKDGGWAFPDPVGVDQYHNSGSDVNLTISSDGKVMIMSMERSDSYGQSDLYISYLKGDDSWTYPKNMGRGINSPYRESAPHLSKDMQSIYFSSDRSYPGRGCDIYFQEKISSDWMRWSGPRKFRSPINSDGDDSHPYFNQATGYLYFTSDRDGTFDIFRIQIKEPLVITMPVEQEQLVASKQEIPFVVGSKIEFSKIYFAQSKSDILHKSYPELHRLSVLLKNNPSLLIRVEGHTDNVGDKALLLQLSEERAEAIKAFLVVKKNINPLRIKTKGYGGAKPLNDNSNEKLRKQNRRVEIEVLGRIKENTAQAGTR